MNIDLAVFDLAGTTVEDSDNVYSALALSVGQEGFEVQDSQVRAVMGYPKPKAIEILIKDQVRDSSDIQDLIKSIYQSFEQGMISFYQHNPEVRERTGVTETFRALREAGAKIAIDTGFNRIITDTIISRLGWGDEGLIDTSVSADEVENGRPFPDMIFHCMESTMVTEVSRVAKIGDTISDLEEGYAAGCKFVVGICSSNTPEEILRKGPHTHIIHEIPELLEIL